MKPTEKTPAPAPESPPPLAAPAKTPERQAILGLTDTIPELRQHIAGLDIDPDLKTFINSELDELKTRAAKIHLHDIEAPEGGFDLHLSVRPLHLGMPPAKS